MTPLAPSWFGRFLPAPTSVGSAEILRSSAGALLGILLTGFVSSLVLGPSAAAVWLIAPMGASAVLLFGVPASPLAQPWSIVGGNLVAAVVGVSCFKVIGAPIPAAATAILIAIAAMFALRCLHPPSGAVALTAVLGGSQVHAMGYGFVITPVALNSVLMLIVALVYNNAVGRRYPHSQRRDTRGGAAVDAATAITSSFRTEDLEAVLKDYQEVLDVSTDDLETLFRRTEMRTFRRRFGETSCRQIMSSPVVSVEYATELDEAWKLVNVHALHALPVINRARHVIGIVTRSDFLRHADLRDYHRFGAKLRAFLRKTMTTHSDKHEVVGQIMTAPVKTAHDTAPIVELVPLMADAGLYHVPIVDADRRLVGMVRQPAFLAALYAGSLAKEEDQPTAA